MFFRYITQRIQMLYRPVMENSSDLRNPNLNDVESNNRNNNNNGTNVTTNDDPPPKYTPPPSYSTATGTRYVIQNNMVYVVSSHFQSIMYFSSNS